jgi:hypothetical protein
MQLGPERSGHSTTPANAPVRLTVQEAAQALGVTVEAVRGRMHRGTYMKEKTEEGRVFVRLTPKQLAEAHERSSARTPHVHDRAALIEELRDHNAFLRRELEARTQEISRRDTVITQLSRRLETLEASQPASKGADESLRAEKI